MIRSFFSLFTVFMLLTTYSSVGIAEIIKKEHVKTQQNELKQINKEIKKLSKTLKSNRLTKQQTEQELAELDLKLAEVRTNLQHFRTKMAENQRVLHYLAKDFSYTEKNISTLKKDLKNLIKFAWLQSEQSPLKIFLVSNNQESPVNLLVLSQYLATSEAQKAKNLQRDVNKLNKMHQQINYKNTEIQTLIKENKEKQQTLLQTERKRNKLIAKLNSKFKKNKQKQDQLLMAKEDLENVLVDLKPIISSINDKTKVIDMRGKLRYPVQVKGNAVKSLNMPFHKNGRFIPAKAGQPVRSMFKGTVIFADWIRGYGLLMIIDHGSGYISLYAHNQLFYKKAGELVRTGDIISAAGQSGGMLETGLYFELRKDGKPLKLEKWLAESTHKKRWSHS